MTGTVYAHDVSTIFEMDSVGTLYSFTRMGSDQEIPGPGDSPLYGERPTATGYMQRIDVSAVPEPASIGLFAIGLFVLARGRTRRQNDVATA